MGDAALFSLGGFSFGDNVKTSASATQSGSTLNFGRTLALGDNSSASAPVELSGGAASTPSDSVLTPTNTGPAFAAQPATASPLPTWFIPAALAALAVIAALFLFPRRKPSHPRR